METAKKILLILTIGVLAIFIQGSLIKAIFPSLVSPNLILVLVVFLSFYDVTPLGAFMAFLLGLELDLYTGVLLGPNAAAMVVVFGVFSALSQRIFVHSGFAAMVAVLFSSMLDQIVYMILISEFRPVGVELVTIAIIEAILSALVAPVLFSLFRFCFGKSKDSEYLNVNI